MNAAHDLSDLANPRSVIRKHAGAHQGVYLTEFENRGVALDASWNSHIIVPAEVMRVHGDASPEQAVIRAAAERRNYLRTRCRDGVAQAAYEAIRNAFSHGNNEHGEKPIILSHRWLPTHVEFAVEDTAHAPINPHLFPYISHVRIAGENAPGFYEFVGEPMGELPRGQGVKQMLLGADQVRFFPGKALGGLLVYQRSLLPVQEQHRMA